MKKREYITFESWLEIEISKEEKEELLSKLSTLTNAYKTLTKLFGESLNEEGIYYSLSQKEQTSLIVLKKEFYKSINTIRSHRNLDFNEYFECNKEEKEIILNYLSNLELFLLKKVFGNDLSLKEKIRDLSFLEKIKFSLLETKIKSILNILRYNMVFRLIDFSEWLKVDCTLQEKLVILKGINPNSRKYILLTYAFGEKLERVIDTRFFNEDDQIYLGGIKKLIITKLEKLRTKKRKSFCDYFECDESFKTNILNYLEEDEVLVLQKVFLENLDGLEYLEMLNQDEIVIFNKIKDKIAMLKKNNAKLISFAEWINLDEGDLEYVKNYIENSYLKVYLSKFFGDNLNKSCFIDFLKENKKDILDELKIILTMVITKKNLLSSYYEIPVENKRIDYDLLKEEMVLRQLILLIPAYYQEILLLYFGLEDGISYNLEDIASIFSIPLNETKIRFKKAKGYLDIIVSKYYELKEQYVLTNKRIS